jgi:hypothetical protein
VFALLTVLVLGAAPADSHVSLSLDALFGDPSSPEFLEYRDLPRGVTLPSFRFAGRRGAFEYDLFGADAGQDDQRYRARLGHRAFTVAARFDDLPHRLGHGTTPFGGGRTAARLPSSLRRAVQDAVDARASAGGPVDYAFLAPLASDLLRGGRPVDLSVQRRDAAIGGELRPADGLSLHAGYGVQRRHGLREGGVGFGLMNAVDVVEPVDELTHTATFDAALERGWGVLRGGVRYDAYRNRAPAFAVDNPLRSTDATAPGAHLGPNGATTAGAARADIALAPGNDAITLSGSTAIRLPRRTRLTADATFSTWSQADVTLPAPTSNAAILAAFPAASPIPRLDGSIRTGAQAVQLSAAPWAGLSLRARVRRQELDNRTPRVARPGVARLDAVWEDVARITVPYSHQSLRAEASAGYALRSWRLEAGARREDVERTFRETEETRETAWSGAISGALPGDGHLRLHYERARRDVDAYDSRASPGASRVGPHPVRSLGAGRRYDQAVRDRHRAGARVEIAPAGPVVIAASYALDLRRYPQTAYGLVETRAHAAGADATLAPGGRFTAHAFYALERGSSFQRTRHSPQPSISVDLRDIWDASLRETAHGAGVGVTADLVPDRTTLRAEAAVHRADGRADFSSPPGGDPDLGEDIDAFDDVRWLTVSADLEHRVGGGWWIGAGAAWETQSVSSVFDEDLPAYVPGAFVLGPGDPDYGAGAVRFRVTRRW